MISGMGGVFLQGIAWIDMSQKSGGALSLKEIIIDAPPCELCKGAQRMLNQSDDRDRAPLIDWAKVSKMSLHFTSSFTLPKAAIRQLPTAKHASHADKIPDGFIADLLTPPPRAAV